MKKEFKVPFIGNEMQGFDWNEDRLRMSEQIFKPNEKFYDTLEYVEYDMGSRCLTVYLKSMWDGTVYRMFYSEFDKIIPKMMGGKIAGYWSFKKHSSHYSLIYISE